MSRSASGLRRIAADQRVRYLVVGSINTALSMGLFILLDLLLGPSVYSFVPLTLAWAISVICVFFVQRALVFRVSGHVLRDLVRFAGVNAGALGVNLVLLGLASDVLRLPRVPSQLAITAVTVVATYLAHKHLSLRLHPDETSAGQVGKGPLPPG